MNRSTGDVYYEWAHRKCHPETCSCRKDYRIIEYPYTIDWAESELEAEKLVRFYKINLRTRLND